MNMQLYFLNLLHVCQIVLLFRQGRLRAEKALLIQRVYRGHLGQLRAMRRREERALFLALAPYAILIQRNVRGYLCRILNTQTSKRIREMYFNRKKEVQWKNLDHHFDRSIIAVLCSIF